MNKINKLDKYINNLRCPSCGEKLSFKDKDSNSLVCKKKKHFFTINKDTPILVDNKLLDDLQKKTEKSFNYKWFHPSLCNYGLNDPAKDFQRKWYLKKYGFNNKKFNDFIKDKENILDAGCGSGWGSKWFSEINKKANIFAVDLSEDSNSLICKNFKNIENVFGVNADIANLPFPKKFFDFISCEQVLHHTSNPYNVFLNFIKSLKKGGVLCFYVYKEKPFIRELSDTYIREKTVEMDFKECLHFSKAITLLGKSLSDINIDFNIKEDIPLLGIKKGKHNLQRFIYWHFLKCFWNKEWGMDKSVLVNFDWYSPKNAFRYNPEEIKKWISKKNLKLLNFYVDEAGISVMVKKIL